MGITIGVVGCGNILRLHAPGFEKAGVRVKWVCDVAESAARPWGERLKAQVTTDYRTVLADPEVQAVDVTTISSAHRELCLAAIEAGKAVICEKTLAENADDALAIVKRARDRRTIFYTSYMKRFIPAMEKAKELLPSLGTIVSTHIRAYQCWGAPWDAVGAGSHLSVGAGGKSEVCRKYGGGILVCGGSHILDLVGFFVGRPTRLYASMHTPQGTDCDLQAAALMETANGVVHYEALAHSLRRIGFLRDGWDERIEINGMQGRLEVYSSVWDNVEHKASLLVHYDNATGASTEYRFAPESAFARAIAFFCQNIERGVQGSQSAVTGYDVDELIAHIKKSAASGTAVDVAYRI